LNDFTPSIKIKLNEANALQRNADGSYELSDFDIDTSIIKRIVVNQKITYTFKLTPKEEVNDKIFNIVYYFKEGWQYDIFEIKPKPENLIELKQGLTKKIDGTLTKVFQSSFSQTSNGCTIVTIWIENCAGCKGPTCDECSICLYHTTVISCVQTPLDLVIDPGPSIGGGGSGHGYGDSNPPINPQSNDENAIATSPIINVPSLVAPQKTPCTDLNNKSANPDFKHKMQELASDANGAAEAGRVTYNNSPKFGNKTYGGLDSNGNSYCKLDWNNARASQTTGFIHCHLNSTNPALKTLTVFSLTDFVGYATLVENSAVDVSELGIFVTTDRGTFALKLTDKQAIIDLANYIVNNEEDALRTFESKVKYGQSKNKQIKGLLNFFKEKTGTGIELYESDSNFENWKKKSLDENGNVQTTDC
jgi:hypothetical protein